MWSNVVSIDKYYQREYAYILNRIDKLKCLSYATEESKDRKWIYLASLCEMRERAEEEIESILETVYLNMFKFRFFAENIYLTALNTASVALLSSLVHFDTSFESSVLKHVLSETIDYNVDGLLNFRLRALKDNWAELSELANNLLSVGGGETDIYNVASFITSSEEDTKGRIALKNGVLTRVNDKRRVEIVDLYANEEFNLLHAIIKEHPSEIILDGTALSNTAVEALKHIGRVVVK